MMKVNILLDALFAGLTRMCLQNITDYYFCCPLPAQAVFWHSTAHILGEAMERVYGGCLCYGPPIESGYYYDMFLEDKQVSCT